MLALLRDHVTGTQPEHRRYRLHQVTLAAQHPCLGVVYDDQVHLFHDRQQVFSGAVDPIIHRVERDELRLRHLLQYVRLQDRVNVAQENVGALARRRRDPGLEVREDA